MDRCVCCGAVVPEGRTRTTPVRKMLVGQFFTEVEA